MNEYLTNADNASVSDARAEPAPRCDNWIGHHTRQDTGLTGIG
jgi:hypothetical protein